MTKSLQERLNSHCSIIGDCIVWNGAKNERGYGVINVGRREGTLLTHRASWLIHNGSLPKNLILHMCDVRNCVNINHLKEGTSQDNTDDMMRKKRYKMPIHHKGSKNGNAILNEEKALEIKKLLKEGKSMMEVSKDLNQPYSRVCDIKYQRTWAHLLKE